MFDRDAAGQIRRVAMRAVRPSRRCRRSVRGCRRPERNPGMASDRTRSARRPGARPKSVRVRRYNRYSGERWNCDSRRPRRPDAAMFVPAVSVWRAFRRSTTRRCAARVASIRARYRSSRLRARRTRVGAGRRRRFEIHHAGHRIAAPQRALRAGQDFDARRTDQIEICEVDGRTERRIVDRDAVDHHQQLVGFGAAESDFGDAADAAGLADCEAGRAAQQIGRNAGLTFVDCAY